MSEVELPRLDEEKAPATAEAEPVEPEAAEPAVVQSEPAEVVQSDPAESESVQSEPCPTEVSKEVGFFFNNRNTWAILTNHFHLVKSAISEARTGRK